MVKVKKRQRRRGALGSSRNPRILGVELDEAFYEKHTVWEYAFYSQDYQSSDWVVAKDRDGDPNAVSYKYHAADSKKPDAELKIDFSITEAALPESRGSTYSRLYLEVAAVELKKGRFLPFLVTATMRSEIEVRVRSKFDRLADFKPHYDEFRNLLLETGSRAAALKAFANKHIMHDGHHYSTDFYGKRCKTVEHEVQHLRHAQRDAEALSTNLSEQLRSEGGRKSSSSAALRVRRLIDLMSSGWNSDPKGEFHRRIVERDCLVMIGIYEALALSPAEAKAAGNPNPTGGLFDLLDPLTIKMMEKLGEPFEMWGE